MNYLQKLFMLTVLAKGAYVNEARAESSVNQTNIRDVIHEIVERNAQSIAGNNDLPGLVRAIIIDLDAKLQNTPPGEHKELKDAVATLKSNPQALTSLLTIVAHLKKETKDILRKHAPVYVQGFLK